MTTTRRQAAAAFFRARLDFQTDVSDVHAALAADHDAEHQAVPPAALKPTLIVLDSRSGAAWDQGHIPGALHLPTADIPAKAAALLDPGVPVVAYCWGPGCNGATRAALALSEAGFDAKEMLGGIEYWIREGFAVRTEKGEETAEPDPLTAPRLSTGAACGC
jgi:rhodanese-related sulfurtransferase